MKAFKKSITLFMIAGILAHFLPVVYAGAADMSFNAVAALNEEKTNESEIPVVDEEKNVITQIEDGKTAFAYITVKKNVFIPEELMLAIAQYDAEGVLANIKCNRYDTAGMPDGATQELSVSVVMKGNEGRLKAFLWDARTQKPFNSSAAPELYVSADGSDGNSGISPDAPFRTLEKARDVVREISADMDEDIVINILGEGGTLFLDKPFRLYTEDSAHNGKRIIYRGVPAEGKELAVVSAGTPITGWQKSAEYPELWEAEVTDDDLTHIRQLYINGRKSFMAQGDVEITGIDYYKKSGSVYTSDGMYVSKDLMGKYINPDDVELWWARNWKHISCPVEKIYDEPEDPSQLILEMRQNYWSARSALDDASLTMNPFRPFRVVNAFELLDIPGEHYFNEKTRKLYYMPREDEDMTTAEVIAPKLDKVIKIKGNDIDQKVKNITFENLMLAHVAYNGPAYGGVENAQSTLHTASDGITSETHGGVHAEMTEGLEFKNNYFFGFGGVALNLFSGNIDSVVVGNAFSDISETAFIIGSHFNSDEQYPISPSPPVSDCGLNLTSNSRMWSSCSGSEGNGRSFIDICGTPIRNWNESYSYTSTWSGRPDAAEAGITNYVMFDFDDEYTISEIRLGFDPRYVEDEAKNNYEILLSNDIQFRPGRYVTVTQQTTPAGEWAVYDNKADTNKYRYMMVRALAAGSPLKLSGVYAITYDRKPYTVLERCRNIRFENNYVKRVSDTQYGGAAVNYYYLEDSAFRHNEIEDSPYSGFSFGWGWKQTPNGTKNIEIAYNKFKNISLAMHDGGAIYLLGNHPGTKVHNNFAYNNEGGIGTFYMDSAADNTEWYNNVALYNYYYLLCHETEKNNSFSGAYSTNGDYLNSATAGCRPRDTVLVSYSGAPAAVKRVMTGAGLEPEYEHIKKWVPDGDMRLVQQEYRLARSYDFAELGNTLYRSTLTAAKTVLDENRFGSRQGEIPLHYKTELWQMTEEVERASGESLQIKGYKAQQLRRLMTEMDEAYDSQASGLAEDTATDEVNGWYNRSATENSEVKRSDGTYLAPRYNPHMESYVDPGTEKVIRITPSGTVENTNITLILAAGAKYGMDRNSDRSDYDRFELAVNADSAALCSVKSGVRSVISENIPVSELKPGRECIFSYMLSQEEGNVRVRIYQDGNEIVNATVPSSRSGGYFGVLTENQGLTVK